MTTLFFQGFNPIIPILAGLILLIVCFTTAWWSYSYLSTVAPWKKWSLIAIRDSVFFILVVLLLNPFFIDRNVETSSPQINVYLDNTQSLTVERGNYSGLESYRSVVNELTSQIDDRYDVNFHLFDTAVNDGREISGNGTVTNLQSVVDHQIENQDQTVANLLFSDGIYTQGRNPVFSAQNLGTPLFTVPIGDTTDVQDIVISDVEYNEQSYTNTEQSFRVNVNQDGFEGSTITVQFLKDGELAQSEQITFSESISNHLLLFTDQHTEPGFYEYEINIPGLDKEFTLQNNREEFTVEVLDEKTRIASLAFEIHPDVGAFRRLIATDQQNELISGTRLSNGAMMGEDLTSLDTPPDLIVLHGLPDSNDPLLDWLQQQNEVPVIYFMLPATRQYHQRLDDANFLVYSIENSRQNIIDIHLLQEREPYSHPLLEFSPQEFRRFPTLKTYRSEAGSSALAEILFTGEFQRTETDIPIILTESGGVRRLAGINAFGWHRFNLTANETVSRFYTTFFTDLLSWAATPPNQQNLSINTIKPTFTETENIEIQASLVNERQQPETDAVINVTVIPADVEADDLESDPQRFVMRHTRNGEYRVNIGNLPRGNYQVTGNATKADRQIGEDQARFSVSQSRVEFINTERDDQLLQQLALRTGGIFLGDYSASPMLQFLEENNLDQVVETATQETRYFSNSPLWFVFVILLLTGEWLIRRSLSLP
ncbi:hypothetical protein [Rhodohalobacter sp. 8-1]|uniref:hypothetical protein n=1 Tax=Rhodohalobacter sp. 8-1 TaxID=3131972 RepID=UPI0030EB1CC2